MQALQITDPAFFGRTPSRFSTILARSYRRYHPEWILLRDKQAPNYPALAVRFLSQARRFKARLLLHGDYSLAKRLGADGVHLSSRQRAAIRPARQMGLWVSISCHSEDEALRALRLGAHRVTLSPVFQTPQKGSPLGLAGFKPTADKIGPKLVALGGIWTPEQVQLIAAEAPVAAFASIRFFLKGI